MAMSLETKVRMLSTMTTRDECGFHFTILYDDESLRELEANGLIVIDRPIHEPTSIPYSEDHHSVELTESGLELVEANPEYHAE